MKNKHLLLIAIGAAAAGAIVFSVVKNNRKKAAAPPLIGPEKKMDAIGGGWTEYDAEYEHERTCTLGYFWGWPYKRCGRWTRINYQE